MNEILTPAALSVYLLELIKGFWRTYVAHDPTFDFPPKLIAALLVVLNAASSLLLAVLAVPGNEIPTDWTSWTRTLVLAILSALVSSALYVVGLRPFKQANAIYEFEEATKEFVKTGGSRTK